jgi:hypothetical protein
MKYRAGLLGGTVQIELVGEQGTPVRWTALRETEEFVMADSEKPRRSAISAGGHVTRIRIVDNYPLVREGLAPRIARQPHRSVYTIDTHREKIHN